MTGKCEFFANGKQRAVECQNPEEGFAEQFKLTAGANGDLGVGMYRHEEPGFTRIEMPGYERVCKDPKHDPVSKPVCYGPLNQATVERANAIVGGKFNAITTALDQIDPSKIGGQIVKDKAGNWFGAVKFDTDIGSVVITRWKDGSYLISSPGQINVSNDPLFAGKAKTFFDQAADKSFKYWQERLNAVAADKGKKYEFDCGRECPQEHIKLEGDGGITFDLVVSEYRYFGVIADGKTAPFVTFHGEDVSDSALKSISERQPWYEGWVR